MTATYAGVLLLMAATCAGCAAAMPLATERSALSAGYQVEIRRTAYGIPHIKAPDWASLGYGYGYAQATDNLCTLAEAFVTYRGQRARFFGPEAKPAVDSTLGQPQNLDADFFFRLLATDAVIDTYRRQQPRELQELIKGFAAGYSRYVRDIKAGAASETHRACRSEAWVSTITDADIYRRLYAMNLAGGYTRFITAIATAQPPDTAALSGRQADATPLPPSGASTWLQAGGRAGIGSNALGFGGQATGTGQGLLFGNPHWFWRGPDRFYQGHLTIPGILDVSGASLLGIPVILIGFNHHVAWSHTVSTARRFGIFELTLAPAAPTTYMYDGQPVAMTAVPLSIDVKRADGTIEPVTRTLYHSRFGPLVNLTSFSSSLPWSDTKAFAMRDINADNFRIFRTFLAVGRARSLDEFIHIQKTQVAMPWVNTIAIGRSDSRTWYADIGAIPHVPDALAATCGTTSGQAFTTMSPGTPFLDGARSACDWQTDAQSVQAGALPVSHMPSLWRDDYVANMNDSYWLTNPAHLLTGFPHIIGSERTPQSLRSRLGHMLVQARLAGTDGYQGNRVSSAIVRHMTLNSRVLSAELGKSSLLASVCQQPLVSVAQDTLTGEVFTPAQEVNIAEACKVLDAWDNTGNPEARGAHLWDELWARVQRIDAHDLYTVPFDPADPVHTPRGLKVDNPLLAQALGVAVLRVRQSGFALDAPRRETLFATRHGHRIPLFGGCDASGYFTATCSEHRIEQGGYAMDDNPDGNTYMQVVTFTAQGVESFTLLASSQSDDPASRHCSDYTHRYAAKHWLRVPFYEKDIASDPALTHLLLDE